MREVIFNNYILLSFNPMLKDTPVYLINNAIKYNTTSTVTVEIVHLLSTSLIILLENFHDIQYWETLTKTLCFRSDWTLNDAF